MGKYTGLCYGASGDGHASRLRFPQLAGIDTAVEVYLDGELVLHHQTTVKEGRLAFFAERGAVTFEDTVLHRMGESL